MFGGRQANETHHQRLDISGGATGKMFGLHDDSAILAMEITCHLLFSYGCSATLYKGNVSSIM